MSDAPPDPAGTPTCEPGPWQRAVLAALEEPMRAAGLGDPLGALAGDRPDRMWHTDATNPHRPRPESIVWTRGGCYDVTLTEGRSGRVVLRTEGGTIVLDEPRPETPAALETRLRAVAPHLRTIFERDIVAFERDNGGYLPGMEPREPLPAADPGCDAGPGLAGPANEPDA